MKKRIFGLLLVMCMLAAFAPCVSAARVIDSGFCGDNLTWTLDDDGILTISGSGDMWDCDGEMWVIKNGELADMGAPWYRYIGKIRKLKISEGVTSVGAHMFDNCAKLASIEFPDSLTTISEYAFGNCENLRTVTLPPNLITIGENAFTECHRLENIVIGDKVTDIGGGAFSSTRYAYSGHYDDDGALYIGNYLISAPWVKGEYVIKDGTLCIADGAFYRNSSITHITIPGNIQRIGDSTFYGCDNLESVILPDGVKEIEAYAFCYCEKLNSISLPDTITNIEYNAFNDTGYYNNQDNWADGVLYINNCLIAGKNAGDNYAIKDGTVCIADETGLYCQNLVIPDSVLYIGDSAFHNCYLHNVTIAEGVTNIGSRAFYGNYCDEITIPSSVTYIGAQAFERAINSNINVSPSNQYYCSENGVLFNKEKSELIQYPREREEEYIIPSSVTKISDGAFSCCDLKKITIPAGVSRIGSETFLNCDNMSNVTLSYGLTAIGDSAFYGCTSLKNITLPDSLKSIDANAFVNCRSLEAISIPNTVSDIGESAFSDCVNLTAVKLPDNITTIASDTFKDCTALTDIIAPDGVTKIGEQAFYNCTSLSSVTLPDNVTQIGQYAFENTAYMNDTSNLTDGILYIGNYLIKANDELAASEGSVMDDTTLIADEAFYCNTSLQKVILPQGLKYIGNQAFWSCTSLDDITMPDSVINIGTAVFDYTSYYDDSSNWDNGVLYIGNWLIDADDTVSGNYTVRDGTVGIADYAFNSSCNIINIIIPDGVKYIGDGAFGCTDSSLVSIEIPKSVVKIGNYAFRTWDSIVEYIYFSGNESEWNNIDIEKGNAQLLNSEIYFSSSLHDYSVRVDDFSVYMESYSSENPEHETYYEISTKIRNNTDTAIRGTLLYSAIYDKHGVLKGVAVTDIDIDALSGESIDVKIANPIKLETDDYIKSFLWNDNIQPLANANALVV